MSPLLTGDKEAAGWGVAINVFGANAVDRVCREPAAWLLQAAAFKCIESATA